MHKMTEISNIRNFYFEEGKSVTEVNRITGKDRKTIRNYIDKEDWNKPERILCEVQQLIKSNKIVYLKC